MGEDWQKIWLDDNFSIYEFLRKGIDLPKKEEKKDFGLELNFSLVSNQDGYEVGLNYKDSDDNCGAYEGSNSNLYFLLEDAISGLVEDIYAEEKEDEITSIEEAYNNLADKYADLLTKYDILLQDYSDVCDDIDNLSYERDALEEQLYNKEESSGLKFDEESFRDLKRFLREII